MSQNLKKSDIGVHSNDTRIPFAFVHIRGNKIFLDGFIHKCAFSYGYGLKVILK